MRLQVVCSSSLLVSTGSTCCPHRCSWERNAWKVSFPLLYHLSLMRLPTDQPCDKVSWCLSHSHSDWLKVTLHFSPPAITCFPALPNISITHTRSTAATGGSLQPFSPTFVFPPAASWALPHQRVALFLRTFTRTRNKVIVYGRFLHRSWSLKWKTKVLQSGCMHDGSQVLNVEVNVISTCEGVCSPSLQYLLIGFWMASSRLIIKGDT